MGAQAALDALQLGHELVVHVQAARGVQNDDVAAGPGGPGKRLHAYVHRVLGRVAVEHRHLDLGPQLLELLDGRRALGVRRHQIGVAALLFEHKGQLAAGGGLARALQAHHHEHVGGLAAQVQWFGLAAHEGAQLVSHDLDDLLGRGEALHHLLAHGAVLDLGDELLGDLVVDVGFQQGQAHLSQGLGDVALRELAVALEPLESQGQPIAEVVKHDWSSLPLQTSYAGRCPHQSRPPCGQGGQSSDYRVPAGIRQPKYQGFLGS